jgi:hypothetical protein
MADPSPRPSSHCQVRTEVPSQPGRIYTRTPPGAGDWFPVRGLGSTFDGRRHTACRRCSAWCGLDPPCRCGTISRVNAPVTMPVAPATHGCHPLAACLPPLVTVLPRQVYAPVGPAAGPVTACRRGCRGMSLRLSQGLSAGCHAAAGWIGRCKARIEEVEAWMK